MISDTIEPRQEQVQELYQQLFPEKTSRCVSGVETFSSEPKREQAELSDEDRFILEEAFLAKNGAKFRRLFEGQWSSDYPSQSEADSALCWWLVYWFGRDHRLVDAVFRHSGLHRKKWDERHHADGWTYGEETIKRAIDGIDKTYQEGQERQNTAAKEGSGENFSESAVKTPSPAPSIGLVPKKEKFADWQKARDLFPKREFPWEVFPEKLAESLKQLARSCATSPTALPGAAMAITASLLGATVCVSPKSSWREPLILWFIDIRPSGAGKTPALKMLSSPLYEFQKNANQKYDEAKKKYDQENAERRGRNQGVQPPPPPRPHGYFITDYTLEGLHRDLSGHGGTITIMDEASAIITSQNQYKSKGNDRETMLKLYDGTSARIVRADTGKTITIAGARLQIVGGIQPEVWGRFFGGDDKLYLSDGTIYRFLPTIEGDMIYELTPESWASENTEYWVSLTTKAKEWADRAAKPYTLKEGGIMDPQGAKVLCLNTEAQKIFLDWANRLESIRLDLPEEIRNFIPKIRGAALRLAGVLYCIERFHHTQEPAPLLKVQDIQKGIKAAEYYMGHAVSAIERLVCARPGANTTIDSRTIHLAKTIRESEGEFEKKLLPIGVLVEKFNEACASGEKIKSARKMGSFLRSCGLTIPPQGCRWKEKANVRCLIWDERLEEFLHALEAAVVKKSEPESQEIGSGGRTKELFSDGDVGDVGDKHPTIADSHKTTVCGCEDVGDINSEKEGEEDEWIEA